MPDTILMNLIVFYFAVVALRIFPESESHGFEVLQGPCSPGSIRSPNPCESCWCGFFGFQYYCIKTCFYNPPVIRKSTPAPITLPTPTARSQQGAGNQVQTPVSNGNQNAAVERLVVESPTTTTTTQVPVQQTPGDNDEDMSINILPPEAPS